MENSNSETLLISWLSRFDNLIHKNIFDFAKSAEDQEDLYQDICLCLWNSIPKFKGDCSECTWIYRISKNVCINSYRQKKRQSDTLNLYSDLYEDEQGEEIENDYLWLDTNICNMKLIDRSLVQLCLHGHSNREIANTLNISESFVRVKKHRLTTKLSKAWRMAS